MKKSMRLFLFCGLAVLLITAVLLWKNHESETPSLYYFGAFSGRDAHLNNSFYRGITLFVGEYNKGRRFSQLKINSLDYEGKAETLRSLLEKEQKSFDATPVIVHGSDPILKDLQDKNMGGLAQVVRYSIQYPEIEENSSNRFCVANQDMNLLKKALSFLNNNLKVKNPGLIVADKFQSSLNSFESFKDVKNYAARINEVGAKSAEDAFFVILPEEQVFSTLKLIRKQGFKGAVVVVAPLSFLDMHQQLLVPGGDTYLVSNFSAWTDESPWKEFNELYVKQYNEKPSQYAFYGYRCANSILNERQSSGLDELIKAFKVEEGKDVIIPISN